VCSALEIWIIRNPIHPHHAAMLAFKAAGYPRRDHRPKEIRNDLVAVIGTNKSWEDTVGLAIARRTLAPHPSGDSLQA